jgi:N-acetylglucosaminyldiphosphoundecaprenol N-acetyl-beta-D-mannosaminyltransferase
MKISMGENGGNRRLPLGEANVFGYQISCRGIDGDITLARNLIASGRKGRYVACANPHSLVVASHDPAFTTALKHSDLLLPDGKGILMAARALNFPIKERVTGSEFFYGLTVALAKQGGTRYFFLGSTNQVLKLITDRMIKEFPSIKVCGTLSPPFKAEFSDDENGEMVAAVNAAQADVLWVGMTAPKQEKWIYENRNKLQVPLIGAIGAVFDFFAGTRKRSSVFWQKLGLEWLPRFLREPQRLWERNLKSTPIFLYWIAREMVRKTNKSKKFSINKY